MDFRLLVLGRRTERLSLGKRALACRSAGPAWLAGHWQAIENGWQWVAGFWAPDNVAEVQYLPSPPPTLDQGPTTPAPDDNSTYVPGCWAYQQTRYLWRPGHWVGNKPDWVWIPASYTWTPVGCLYNDGYWDHPLDERCSVFSCLVWSGAPK